MSDDLDVAWAELRPYVPPPEPTPCCAVCGYVRPDDVPQQPGEQTDMAHLEFRKKVPVTSTGSHFKEVVVGKLVVCGTCFKMLSEHFNDLYERERVLPLRRKLAQLEEAVHQASRIANDGPLDPEPEPASERGAADFATYENPK